MLLLLLMRHLLGLLLLLLLAQLLRLQCPPLRFWVQTAAPPVGRLIQWRCGMVRLEGQSHSATSAD